MSIIREALKKREEELHGGGLPGRQPLPPPVPTMPEELEEPVRKSAWRVVVGVLLLLVFCLVVAVVALRVGLMGLLKEAQDDARGPEAPPVVAQSEDPVEAATTDDGASAVSAVAAGEPERADSSVGKIVARVVERVNAAGERAGEADEVIDSAGSSASPSRPSPPVVWPEAVLRGVMASAAQQPRSAMFGNRFVEEGQMIDGMRVIAIEHDAVRLNYQGEEKRILVGQSTR